MLELTKHYDVVLLTHAYFREHIEPALLDNPLRGLKVHYFAPPAFGAHPHKQLNSRLYYTWWQWNARSFVARLLKNQPVDLIHHLTWGTFRFPCFLGRLGVPLVMGPLGGGESAPLHLFAGLPFRERMFDWIRSVSLRFARLDPLAMVGPKSAELVLCKTSDTLQALPASVQARAVVAPEIGAPEIDLSIRASRVTQSRPFRLLYAGRLLGWKGVGFAVGAMRCLAESGHDVVLDIAGGGSLHDYLCRESQRFGIADRVRLLGQIPREDLLKLYGQADIFIFPSLHDSSGNVVLESLSRGLPVVCLDLGGPKHYVTPECGVVVSTHERSRAQVESALADAIGELITQPQRLREMSNEAIRQASLQTWAARVNSAYDLIEQRLAPADA